MIYDSQFLVAALCVFVAKSTGQITDPETQKMLELVGEHFQLPSGEALGLLTRAMEDLAENPDLVDLLKELGTGLPQEEKKKVAVMLLKVVAADGRQEAEEMEALSEAMEIIDIEPDTMHRAFDRYFTDTQIG